MSETNVVDVPGPVRTLNVLDEHRVLGLAVRVLEHDALVTSATPGAAMAEEEGRGSFGQLLLPPLPLFVLLILFPAFPRSVSDPHTQR